MFLHLSACSAKNEIVSTLYSLFAFSMWSLLLQSHTSVYFFLFSPLVHPNTNQCTVCWMNTSIEKTLKLCCMILFVHKFCQTVPMMVLGILFSDVAAQVIPYQMSQNLGKFQGYPLRFLCNFHNLISSLKYEKPASFSFITPTVSKI